MVPCIVAASPGLSSASSPLLRQDARGPVSLLTAPNYDKPAQSSVPYNEDEEYHYVVLWNNGVHRRAVPCYGLKALKSDVVTNYLSGGLRGEQLQMLAFFATMARVVGGMYPWGWTILKPTTVSRYLEVRGAGPWRCVVEGRLVLTAWRDVAS